LFFFIEKNDSTIEENQLSLSYWVGKKKFVKLPLTKKSLDEKDIIIAKLKKEN
jgi:hypothetical protein